VTLISEFSVWGGGQHFELFMSRFMTVKRFTFFRALIISYVLGFEVIQVDLLLHLNMSNGLMVRCWLAHLRAPIRSYFLVMIVYYRHPL
jgi:hypothetical protein